MRRVLLLAALAGCAALLCAAGAGASASGTYVNCDPLKTSATATMAPAFTAAEHPARCDIQGEPEDLADLVQLTGARWTDWGAASTTATGQALSTEAGMGGARTTSAPVKVTLSRIETGCDGRALYTRAEIVSGKAKGTVLKLSDSCRTDPLSG